MSTPPILPCDPSDHGDAQTLVLVGRAERLLQPDVLALLPLSVAPAVWRAMVKSTRPGDQGRVATTWTPDRLSRVCAGVLPDRCSRHNSPARAWAIHAVLRSAGTAGRVHAVLCVDDPQHGFAACCAAAKAYPTFRATHRSSERAVRLSVLAPGQVIAPSTGAANAIRRAAELVDRPTDRLDVDAFLHEATALLADLPVKITVIRGEQLLEEGLHALHAVGRAAEGEPALLVAQHTPPGATEHSAWVGKGIVYDTGGLSIKSKTGMPGMKTDMGGAAAVLAAFHAAVTAGASQRLTAVLCLAENAVGPKALRPDDIITAYSGRTIEVNNTDAEGRLVLADGVAWAADHLAPDTIIDMATLTGAQLVATGKQHAAIYCNDEALERRAVTAGRASGDLVFPVPFAPELFRKEFASQVADMRNSVKDRANAQPSCAGQFIYNHLHAYRGAWLHVDMAGPGRLYGRGTGYGVALLLTLAGVGAPVS